MGASQEYNQKYYREHKEEYLRYRQEHKEELLEYGRKYHQEHKAEAKEWNRNYHQAQRLEVLRAYGGRCTCCGYFDLFKKVRGFGYLQMDHINGGGRRMRFLGYGYGLYRFLIKNHFPPGYRVLCGACNAAIEPGAEECEAHRI